MAPAIHQPLTVPMTKARQKVPKVRQVLILPLAMLYLYIVIGREPVGDAATVEPQGIFQRQGCTKLKGQ